MSKSAFLFEMAQACHVIVAVIIYFTVSIISIANMIFVVLIITVGGNTSVIMVKSVIIIQLLDMLYLAETNST
jgi:hypothetical protein